jgi:hypothetical protein
MGMRKHAMATHVQDPASLFREFRRVLGAALKSGYRTKKEARLARENPSGRGRRVWSFKDAAPSDEEFMGMLDRGAYDATCKNLMLEVLQRVRGCRGQPIQLIEEGASEDEFQDAAPPKTRKRPRKIQRPLSIKTRPPPSSGAPASKPARIESPPTEAPASEPHASRDVPDADTGSGGSSPVLGSPLECVTSLPTVRNPALC